MVPLYRVSYIYNRNYWFIHNSCLVSYSRILPGMEGFKLLVLGEDDQIDRVVFGTHVVGYPKSQSRLLTNDAQMGSP